MEPASKVSVPLTVVTRTIDKAPDKDFDPPPIPTPALTAFPITQDAAQVFVEASSKASVKRPC